MKKLLVIESAFAPEVPNALWLYNGKLKWFSPKGWKDIDSALSNGVTDIQTKATPTGYELNITKANSVDKLMIEMASTTNAGVVKQGVSVNNLATGAEAAAIVTTVNALLTSLRNAGIIVKPVS